MAEVSIRLYGVEEAMKTLRSLESRIRKRVVRKAVTAGSQEIVKAVRRNAPTETKALRKASTKKVKSYRGKGRGVWGIVGARSRKDKTTGRNPARYMHLVNAGTRPHTIAGPLSFGGRVVRSVQHPGTTGVRYIERAARQAERAAISVFDAKFHKEVTREASAAAT